MSLAETIMYGFYLGIVVANGKIDGRTHRRKDFRWLVWDQKKVEDAGLAVLVLWAAAVMTLSKTWLFCEFPSPKQPNFVPVREIRRI